MTVVIKVILPAGRIPLGSAVTKRTGQKPYVLKDKLRAFGLAGGAPTVISAARDVRFLVEAGDANAVSTSTELVWLAHPAALAGLLQTGFDYADTDECPACGHGWDDG